MPTKPGQGMRRSEGRRGRIPASHREMEYLGRARSRRDTPAEGMALRSPLPGPLIAGDGGCMQGTDDAAAAPRTLAFVAE